ncbi:uncharacterized protein ACNLHF_005653 [Anomaloglossus baeobatrachus]
MALTHLGRGRPKQSAAAAADVLPLEIPAAPGGQGRPTKVTWITTWDAVTGGTTTEVRATYTTPLPSGDRPLGIPYPDLETPPPVAVGPSTPAPVQAPEDSPTRKLERDSWGFFWDPVQPSSLPHRKSPSPEPDPVQERLLAETVAREMMTGPRGEELELQFTTGIAVKFNQQEGYGFIWEETTGDDYFYNRVHLDVEGLPQRLHTLYPGEKVRFIPEVGCRGLFAVSVTRMPTTQEAVQWQQELEWEEHQCRRRAQSRPVLAESSHPRRTLAVAPEVMPGPTTDSERGIPAVLAISQNLNTHPVIVLDIPPPPRLIAQALQSGITPLGILRNLPVEYDFALNHTDLWVNKWLGCERNICVGTSLIPVIGREGTIVPVTVLGIPVSETQQVFYQLQYTDFAFDGVNTEQVDISSCLHFVSKVMCLPGQDKVIYHSCFHNHSSCHARIETVQTLHDLVTPVSPNKICFQVMSETEKVSVFYSTCVHKENLPMGLYCIEGNVRSLSKKEGSFNITSIGKRNLTAFPIQFNLSQINDFPWDMWTSEIKKDKGLLDLLTKQLKEAEIIFRHEQGELSDIEHEWNGMSGRTWWRSFGKSVHSWSQSSFQSAVGNVLFNPIIIIFLLVLMCIIYQVFVMCRIQKIYKNVKIEMKKEDNILRGMLNRKMTF